MGKHEFFLADGSRILVSSGRVSRPDGWHERFDLLGAAVKALKWQGKLPPYVPPHGGIVNVAAQFCAANAERRDLLGVRPEDVRDGDAQVIAAWIAAGGIGEMGLRYGVDRLIRAVQLLGFEAPFASRVVGVGPSARTTVPGIRVGFKLLLERRCNDFLAALEAAKEIKFYRPIEGRTDLRHAISVAEPWGKEVLIRGVWCPGSDESFAARDERTPIEALRYLAEHGSRLVLEALAANPAATPEVLEILRARGGVEDTLARRAAWEKAGRPAYWLW